MHFVSAFCQCSFQNFQHYFIHPISCGMEEFFVVDQQFLDPGSIPLDDRIEKLQCLVNRTNDVYTFSFFACTVHTFDRTLAHDLRNCTFISLLSVCTLSLFFSPTISLPICPSHAFRIVLSFPCCESMKAKPCTHVITVQHEGNITRTSIKSLVVNL